MSQPWRRAEAIARVSRADGLVWGDAWTEFRFPPVRPVPIPVVVSRVALRALAASSSTEVAACPWPPDGGVAVELRSRS